MNQTKSNIYLWNPALKIVLDIKKEYSDKFGLDTLNFETWLNKLNSKRYNDFFECLQFNQRDEFIIIRYGLAEMQEGMWKDSNSPYRECRSIVIDLKKENIVLSPFRKFFNLNEVEENKIEVIEEKFKNCSTVEVVDKLDGSMQSARWYNNEVFMAGSQSITREQSWRLNEGYSMLTDNHIEMLRINDSYTFIFEYISLKDAHVVCYEESDQGLYLIGIRDTTTGEQFSHAVVSQIASFFEVKCANKEKCSLEELLERMKKFKSNEKEGWVVNLDGHLVKIKCDDYVSVHRLLDYVSSGNVIIEAIADNKYDDLLSKVPDKYIERVTSISHKVFTYLRLVNKGIEKLYEAAPKENRKDFMIWVDTNTPKYAVPFLKMKYLGKGYNALKKNKTSYKKMSDLEKVIEENENE